LYKDDDNDGHKNNDCNCKIVVIENENNGVKLLTVIDHSKLIMIMWFIDEEMYVCVKIEMKKKAKKRLLCVMVLIHMQCYVTTKVRGKIMNNKNKGKNEIEWE